ncbi:hypothetical protein [Stutzerimonas nitrititolerans]|uniref:hypothetical protein n=1 Tax=Stutzerimonas nitrititolerans TaxID=2482751 RepID=UPI00289EC734|nr:hypothetical protein [Stutzerimonas nitrititolerans]
MSLRAEILDGMAEAAAVVAEIGDLVTLEVSAPGGYDPVTGLTAPGETRTQQARAILDNYGLQSSGQQYADGTQIMRDDKKLFLPAIQSVIDPAVMAPLEWAPTLETKVTAAGQVWKVISIQAINPTGDVLAYELQVRR